MGPRNRVLQAQHLHDMAEQYLHLASDADSVTRNVLVVYASELLDRAQQIEWMVGADEPQRVRAAVSQS